MKQIELIESFINGATSGEASNLVIRDTQLFHYSTPISERYNNQLLLNSTRCSLATDRVQNAIVKLAGSRRITIIHGVPEGVKLPLSAFLQDTVYMPDHYIMVVDHKSFGRGYVISIQDDIADVVFPSGKKKLFWPVVIKSGILSILTNIDEFCA